MCDELGIGGRRGDWCAAHETRGGTYIVARDQDPRPGTREHFLQVTRLRCWGTIQEYVDLCRARGYFTEAFYRKAVAQMERIHMRRMLRQVTDDRGWPTKILLDDAENSAHVLTQLQCEKLHNWFVSDILKLGDWHTNVEVVG